MYPTEKVEYNILDEVDKFLENIIWKADSRMYNIWMVNKH